MLLTAATGFAQTEAVSAAGIQFETGTWAEILAKAKQQNKYVFVDAYTTWCGPCKWMDKNVFPTAEAGDYFNKNFVNAKIDMEKGEGLEIAKTYAVQAYPTYLFVDGDGNLIHRVVGSMETPKFIAASGNALDPDKQYGTLLRKFEAGERNPDFLFNAAHAAQSAFDSKKAQEISAAYLKTQSNLLEEKNVKFISQFTSSATDPNFELCVRMLLHSKHRWAEKTNTMSDCMLSPIKVLIRNWVLNAVSQKNRLRSLSKNQKIILKRYSLSRRPNFRLIFQ